ncbi:TPA: AAA family ATPase [Legionella pneumophila]
MENYYILTGPPGSGKSSVLAELSQRGYSVIEEPARSILRQQRAINGEGVYDINPFLFKELMLSRMLNDYETQNSDAPVFFDRGIPDIIVYSRCFNCVVPVAPV